MGSMCGVSVGGSEYAAAGRTNCHLYHYAGNNPIRYTDPDGRYIDIYCNQDRVVELINKYSYYKYKIDQNNHLVRDGNKKNKGNTSKKYSSVIDAAINNHSKTIVINISDKATKLFSDGSMQIDGYDVEIEGGGGTTSNFSNTLKIITITGRNSIYDIPMKNDTTHKYTPEEILMHELVGHAIPLLLNKTGGSAIFNENAIREELGLNERKETYNDPVVNYNANYRFLFKSEQ